MKTALLLGMTLAITSCQENNPVKDAANLLNNVDSMVSTPPQELACTEHQLPMVVFNEDDQKLYYCKGGSWKALPAEISTKSKHMAAPNSIGQEGSGAAMKKHKTKKVKPQSTEHESFRCRRTDKQNYRCSKFDS